MRALLGVLIAGVMMAVPGLAWAEEAHEHADEQAGAAQEQMLTGEVVDAFCYLSHGEEGLGAKHANCAKKCIKNGLPVAIRVGDQLYLATMSDHNPANQQLGEFAGRQVTVRGHVMERDGQHLISIMSIEPSS